MGTISDSDLLAARTQFEQDGACILRGALPTEWVERMAQAIDRVMNCGDGVGEDFSDEGAARFFGDVFSTIQFPEIAELVKESDLARLAGELMSADKVRFFYDQILVKEPGAANRTPWHQDLPYWPVRGNQIASLWIPVDTATPENGVVSYVKGSHRWDRFFAMQPWNDRFRDMIEREAEETGIYDSGETGKWGSLGDIRDNPDKYEFLTWSVEPGDILVHHALTVHGANGNSSSANRRRAIATRWVGDDATWDDERPHFMRSLKAREDFPYPHHLEQGDELEAPVFPVGWIRSPQTV